MFNICAYRILKMVRLKHVQLGVTHWNTEAKRLKIKLVNGKQIVEMSSYNFIQERAKVVAHCGSYSFGSREAAYDVWIHSGLFAVLWNRCKESSKDKLTGH